GVLGADARSNGALGARAARRRRTARAGVALPAAGPRVARGRATGALDGTVVHLLVVGEQASGGSGAQAEDKDCSKAHGGLALPEPGHAGARRRTWRGGFEVPTGGCLPKGLVATRGCPRRGARRDPAPRAVVQRLLGGRTMPRRAV